MKIKTKTISYDEAMSLPSWEHKQPKKPSKLLATVARIALGGELKQVDFSCEKIHLALYISLIRILLLKS